MDRQITQEQLEKIIRIAFASGEKWGRCYQGHFIPTKGDTEKKMQACIEKIGQGGEQKSRPITNSDLLEIAAVRPEGTGALLARVKKTRELFSFGLLDAKRYVERHFENGGRGALIEQ